MRIIYKYAYICSMKARLNLTIDNALLENIKGYAMKQKTSVSELVESYFKTVAKPTRRKNIINLVEKMEKPFIDASADLKDLYYKGKATKNGI